MVQADQYGAPHAGLFYQKVHHHRSEKVACASAVVTEARDPICGMSVDVATAEYRSEVSGEVVYFCCRQCKKTYDRR